MLKYRISHYTLYVCHYILPLVLSDWRTLFRRLHVVLHHNTRSVFLSTDTYITISVLDYYLHVLKIFFYLYLHVTQIFSKRQQHTRKREEKKKPISWKAGFTHDRSLVQNKVTYYVVLQSTGNQPVWCWATTRHSLCGGWNHTSSNGTSKKT